MSLCNPKRKQEGVCKYLMKLCDEWENMPLEGNNYLMQTEQKILLKIMRGRLLYGNGQCK